MKIEFMQQKKRRNSQIKAVNPCVKSSRHFLGFMTFRKTRNYKETVLFVFFAKSFALAQSFIVRL